MKRGNNCVKPTEGSDVMPAHEPMPEAEPENEFVDMNHSQGDGQANILGSLKVKVF